MVNGLGVVGWGVGGIEAEACMLGQPISMLLPQVVGFKLHGKLPEGSTATDLVLTVTQILRKKGVVGKFVEFYGDGLSRSAWPTAPPSPTWPPNTARPSGFFPVDKETLNYLRFTNRDPHGRLRWSKPTAKEQGLFHTDEFARAGVDETIDSISVPWCLRSPGRSGRRTASNLPDVKKNFLDAFGARRQRRRRSASNGDDGHDRRTARSSSQPSPAAPTRRIPPS